jgi:hypothetical protein
LAVSALQQVENCRQFLCANLQTESKQAAKLL